MITSALAGLGLGLSLIIAIGAQNLFVLRQGLRREHVLLVVVICAASDAALIALGVSGIGLVLQAVPWLIDVVRWAGALFLLGYAAVAARRAWRPAGQVLDATPDARAAAPDAAAGTSETASPTLTRRARTGAAATAATCLALTWLNPHVYLDTVFLLGSVASTYAGDRWWFAAGAMAGSVIWFFALGYSARLLAPLLRAPIAWRILDAVIAVVMVAIAVTLILG